MVVNLGGTPLLHGGGNNHAKMFDKFSVAHVPHSDSGFRAGLWPCTLSGNTAPETHIQWESFSGKGPRDQNYIQKLLACTAHTRAGRTNLVGW